MNDRIRARLRKKLLTWYDQHGRHDLPWKTTDTTGYLTAVSEIMLQQTQVKTVLKKFTPFVHSFPTWKDLALASEEEVFKAWEGLGYYRRAKFLHLLAQRVVQDHQSRLPLDRSARLDLPGVGFSTASALGAFVHGLKEPIWDGNVDRVYRRVLGEKFEIEKKGQALEKWKWATASSLMPNDSLEIKKWTQAIMDLGATVCTPKSPRCGQCPWSMECAFRKSNPQPSDSVQSASGSSVASNAVKRTPKKQMVKRWSIAFRDQKVGLVAPHEKGLWVGLWQFPDLELEGSVLAHGVHLLSHRRVEWWVQTVEPEDLSEEVLWVPIDQLSFLPFPRPLRKWLDEEGQRWLKEVKEE